MVSLNIYLFKYYNRNTRKRCEICPKLILKTPERLCFANMFKSLFGMEVVLVLLLLTLNIFHIFF